MNDLTPPAGHLGRKFAAGKSLFPAPSPDHALELGILPMGNPRPAIVEIIIDPVSTASRVCGVYCAPSYFSSGMIIELPLAR